MSETDGLDEFINEILTTKELPLPSEEVRLQLVADLKKRLIDQINRALISSLPDNKIDELNGILDKGEFNDVELQKVIEDSGVDVKNITIRTMLKFRGLYLQTPQERKA